MDGALKYRDMTVKEVMTVASKVYMLSISEKLNFKVKQPFFQSFAITFIILYLRIEFCFYCMQSNLVGFNYTKLFRIDIIWYTLAKLVETVA